MVCRQTPSNFVSQGNYKEVLDEEINEQIKDQLRSIEYSNNLVKLVFLEEQRWEPVIYFREHKRIVMTPLERLKSLCGDTTGGYYPKYIKYKCKYLRLKRLIGGF